MTGWWRWSSKVSSIKYTGTDDEPRYRMLETVREFGVERLASGGESDARRRHAEHYVRLSTELVRGSTVRWTMPA